MAKLKQTSQVALQITSELSSMTPKNPSQSQNKADQAFEGVLDCIDTAAQATIDSSMKSVNLHTHRRQPQQLREPSPEIQKLYGDKTTLQRQLTYIRAEPANPTQAQRAHTHKYTCKHTHT